MTLDEIQKLCDEATPGPWTLDINHCAVVRPPAPYTHHLYFSRGGLGSAQQYPNTWELVQADAQFIAAARTYLPKLIAVAKAAKTTCDSINATYFVKGGLVGHPQETLLEADMLGALKEALAALENPEMGAKK